MKSYKYVYEYKDEIVNRLKEYNSFVHTNKDKDYDWLGDNYCVIEIKKKGDSLFINLEDEFMISYGKWHAHYNYEDRDDYEIMMDKVNKILNNNNCVVEIYLNNNCIGGCSDLDKDKYIKEDIIEVIKSFFKGDLYSEIREYGVSARVNYWDSSKNYVLYMDKKDFI